MHTIAARYSVQYRSLANHDGRVTTRLSYRRFPLLPRTAYGYTRAVQAWVQATGHVSSELSLCVYRVSHHTSESPASGGRGEGATSDAQPSLAHQIYPAGTRWSLPSQFHGADEWKRRSRSSHQLHALPNRRANEVQSRKKAARTSSSPSPVLEEPRMSLQPGTSCWSFSRSFS